MSEPRMKRSEVSGTRPSTSAYSAALRARLGAAFLQPPCLLSTLELVEPEVEALVIALRLPHLVAPVRFEEGGIGLIGRRTHVGHPGRLGPARTHLRPVVVREIIVGVVVP